MSLTETFMDVVELCTLLQCLGFNVKSLETRDVNMSQDSSARNVVITCQSSGLHVIMESSESRCSCPPDANKNNSGFWEVSGVTGGKQHNTESGSGLLGYLSKTHREQISKELQNIVKFIKDNKTNEKPREANRSASMLELSTPEIRLKLEADTPTRYRSLDTLITVDDSSPSFPMPISFKRQIPKILERQRTYSVSSTPDSLHGWNKTSSPIQEPQISKYILEKLIYATNCCEETQKHIKYVIQTLSAKTKNNSSCQELDVSKIPVFKAADTPKGHYLSCSNIPASVTPSAEKDNLKRSESSTSTITTKEKTSRLRRLSPSLLKLKKDKDTATKVDKKPKESKLTSLFKPNKVLPPPSTSRSNLMSPNLSASNKKFSHIKSTIPKPSSGKPKDQNL
ncbi:uncharacterized protein LOC123713298 [Pieris brassicae]|uniref:Uncharacterized protein n=1 Tax=Pieris brassicae TaxID=7116 RepID=A0A9P0XCT6_PIEBR|nr:uncharacterized protein LOC123713298 [Pieris brassicae]CAH4030195.1 unnamed protein product [Pieris brassicae]